MKTALYDRHLENQAKMVDFAGWQMPLQYKGVIKEHMAVREHVGLFDVSHMGVIEVVGKEASHLLDYLSTTQILLSHKHRAIYTVWSMHEHGTVDDLIIYPEDETHYFVVVNASNRQKSLSHLKEHAKTFDVEIRERFEDLGILALQGPKSLELISPLFLEAKSLEKMHFVPLNYHGEKIILSRTGYTGELGFEIYAPNSLIVELFDWFLNEGTPFGLELVGLGARDTLRLEMGYSLYGHELTESIMPNESLSAWTINWNKQDFIGKEAMLKREASGISRREYSIVIQGKGIPREGFKVFQKNNEIGFITSGNYSPCLEKGIAILLTQEKLHIGDFVDVKIRDHFVQAEVIKLPFINK